MANLQDKICNGLTLAGLLCVIGFGIASLIPDTASADDDLRVYPEPEEPEAEQVLTDTLQEVPMIEDRPAEVKPDTLLPEADSLHLETLPADTAHHSPAHEAEAPKVHEVPAEKARPDEVPVP